MRRGFTLVELLLVIIIICLLAAIIFPVIARARDSGYKGAAIVQMQQLGRALLLYASENDGKFVPSTNYGLPDVSENKIWTTALYQYVKDRKIYAAPGSDGKFPGSWADRGLATIGMNSATAIDEDGCVEGKVKDSTTCRGFTTAASFDAADQPEQIGIFACTPGGPTSAGYRGYEFNPYNGPPTPGEIKRSPPLCSDQDLVKLMIGIPPELIKPIYARYGANSNDRGVTPVVYADSHVVAHTARAIQTRQSNVIWRFR